ncbi:MAG: multicopper oxidase family protein [Methylovulum sp.]|nr:multicopper oxidase family protein [Methylovulum sp.]
MDHQQERRDLAAATDTTTETIDLGRRRALVLGMFGALGSTAAAFGLLPKTLWADSLPTRTANILKEPPVLASSGGTLQTTLRATTKATTVAGELITGTMTYNGQYPGPTLQVKPGDHILLTVRNNLDMSAAPAPKAHPGATHSHASAMTAPPANTLNTHFHGMHVSPLPKADDIYLEIPFGGHYDYDFQIPADHPGGLYWYHPHVHGVVDSQIYAGLAGLLVVEGGAAQIPALQGVRKRLMALKNIMIANGALSTNINPPDETHTINGQLLPTIAIRPGETQLWQVANIGNEPYYKLRLQGHTFTVVAEDGAMLWESYTTDTLLMPPGKRFEFTVTGGKAGSYAFKTLGYNSGPFGDWAPTQLATLVVAGKADTPRTVPVQLGAPPAYLTGPVAKSRYLRFSEGFDLTTNTPYFEINGKTFEALRNGAQIKLGSTEEWLIYNDSHLSVKNGGVAEDHPFHIHVNSFVVTEIDGVPVKSYGTQDVVNVKPGEKVLIRMAFPDFVGKSVFHCHILFHEDNGMMANFAIVP